MECIFIENFDNDANDIIPDAKVIHHIKALRLRKGEEILITNGKGLTARVIIEFNPQKQKQNILMKGSGNYYLKPIEYFEKYCELPFKLGLAMPLLNERARREFALEKAVELGVVDFFSLITKYSQPVKYEEHRLKVKAIAALEQSQRSVLTKLYPPNNFYSVFNSNYINSYNKIIISDLRGKNIENPIFQKNWISSDSVLVIVGPEGGFAPEEIDMMRKKDNLTFLKFADRRLRSETAAVAALSVVTNFIRHD